MKLSSSLYSYLMSLKLTENEGLFLSLEKKYLFLVLDEESIFIKITATVFIALSNGCSAT